MNWTILSDQLNMSAIVQEQLADRFGISWNLVNVQVWKLETGNLLILKGLPNIYY